MNSCLMWAADLRTPVSLSAIFNETDLKDTGIEYESHITVLYAADKFIEYEDPKLRELILPLTTFISERKDKEDNYVPVSELFELSSFSNENDYLILKLKKDNDYYRIVKKTHDALMKNYNVSSKFPTYTPHITLAELEPGTSEKYLKDEVLERILRGSVVHLEDLIISYGEHKQQDTRVLNLTKFNSVDRFFRIRELKQQ